MPLPTITHLQFLILDALFAGQLTGQQIREVLSQHKVYKAGPAFYQLMARLEDAGFVEGSYKQRLVGNQLITERSYKICAAGQKEHAVTAEFYSNSMQLGVKHA